MTRGPRATCQSLPTEFLEILREKSKKKKKQQNIFVSRLNYSIVRLLFVRKLLFDFFFRKFLQTSNAICLQNIKNGGRSSRGRRWSATRGGRRRQENRAHVSPGQGEPFISLLIIIIIILLDFKIPPNLTPVIHADLRHA